MTHPRLNFGSRAEQIDRRALEFHEANPRVWELFVVFADEARFFRPHFSARAVFHRIRWEVAMTTDSDDDLKINNNYSPAYARWYEEMRGCPGFFRSRRRTSEDAPARLLDGPMRAGGAR